MLRVRRLSDTPLFRTDALSIRGVGVRELMPACFISRPSGGDYLLMMFHNRVRIGTPSGDVDAPGGSLVIWRPGEWQAYGDAGREWSHSWIHCSGTFVGRFVREAAVPTSVPIPVRDPATVDRHLFDLHEEITSTTPADGMIVRSLLVLLVRHSTRALRGDRLGLAPPDDLARAQEMINARYAEPLRLDDLAAEAGLSVPHFVGRFHKQFGTPPIQYLTRRRMEIACALLKGTAESVAGIGRRVGYPDAAHFSKAFRNHIGVAPSHVRRAASRG